MFLEKLYKEIIKGYKITKFDAMQLLEQDTQELCKFSNLIRNHFCDNQFDICSIINAKSGQCSENCKFCAQSSFYSQCKDRYPFLSSEKILEDAQKQESAGVKRFSIVTSGRKLSAIDLEKLCEATKLLKQKTNLKICASVGLLNLNEYISLKDAGIMRIHNNLETSDSNFKNICTTHTFQDKLTSIKLAQSIGLEVCSGGIMGLGEGWEDRIDMALALRDLNILSVPINILNPIPGTPFANNAKLSSNEVCKIIAIFRFILPNAFLRLAGGRGLFADKGESCIRTGANAVITGDMLTTNGISVENDLKMIKQLGFKVV